MEGRAPAWIEPMVSAFSRPAFRLAMALVKNPELAEDLVQEAFLRALTSPNTPRQPEDFRRWLYHILLNLVRQHQRRQTRWLRLPFAPQVQPDPELEAQRRLGDEDMARALWGLSPREREAIYLRFFEDAAYDDIAAIMQISPNTTRALVHRALDKLRVQLTRAERRRSA
jgi:RNA polymerase sigma-70 factor (ECF subfamily)